MGGGVFTDGPARAAERGEDGVDVVRGDEPAAREDRAQVVAELPRVKKVADVAGVRPELTGGLGHGEVLRHSRSPCFVGGQQRDAANDKTPGVDLGADADGSSLRIELE